MGNLLGGKNKSRVTELDRAVLGLKKQRDELKRAQKRIEVNFANKSKKFKRMFCRSAFLQKKQEFYVTRFFYPEKIPDL